MIDGWLLDKIFQPVSDFFRRWIGWSCLRLATLCIDLVLVFIGGVILLVPSVAEKVALFVGLIFVIWFRFHLSSRFKQYKRNENSDGVIHINPLKAELFLQRIGNLLFLILFFQDSPVTWLFVFCFYFISCTDLPPGGKFKELLKKALGKEPEGILVG